MDNVTNSATTEFASKVPELTLAFWVIKILATTLGETGGDCMSMSMDMGYLTSTLLFAIVLVGTTITQILSREFHPLIYWTTIIASTTVGTTLADLVTRSLGIGYTGGSTVLLVLLSSLLYVWKRTLGSLSIADISTPRAEIFYWVTITFSQTLGTALGDWVADTAGMGYFGAAVIFGGLLSMVAALYFWSTISRTTLFWSAFILTRPLGAVVGDLVDKPVSDGGLALSRYTATAVLATLILTLVLALPHRAAQRNH